jgi:hypothetical protein
VLDPARDASIKVRHMVERSFGPLDLNPILFT